MLVLFPLLLNENDMFHYLTHSGVNGRKLKFLAILAMRIFSQTQMSLVPSKKNNNKIISLVVSIALGCTVTLFKFMTEKLRD